MSSSSPPCATLSSSAAPTIISKCTVFPHKKSTLSDLKLSISELASLDGHYIQKGCLFKSPSLPSHTLIPHLKDSLSRTLSVFPPLAGRFTTTPSGHVFITCNDAGVDFIHAAATDLSLADLLSPTDLPHIFFRKILPFEGKLSYTGHFSPVAAVQVTEFADGVFIGAAVSESVADGTSYWHFFNTFAELSSGAATPLRLPDFSRESILISDAVLRLADGEIKASFSADETLRERIFSFSGEAIRRLKATANTELKRNKPNDNEKVQISSFQSLCALMLRAVTRARNIPSSKTTTFRITVNVRSRIEPKLDDYYFGNATQTLEMSAAAEDVLRNDLWWCALELNKRVKAYDSSTVRRNIENWERDPRFCVIGNLDGATVQVGSSPRLPMYDNDFGWGRPVAVRSGRAHKFDGKISAFPGRDGGGAVDLEVVLAPNTMAALESDAELLLYLSG